MIVALLFVINSSPYETEKEKFISLNLNMSTAQTKPELQEAQEIPVEPKPEPPPAVEEPVNRQPDPMFEALKSFEAKPTQKVEGVTSGIKTLEIQENENPLNVPESIFEQKTLDFNQVQAALPAKKSINNDILFSTSNRSSNNAAQNTQILDLNALEQYDIPNLDSVKSGLQQDYQSLLSKPGIRKETVSGQVIVELYITGSSANTLVNISSAVSPELANIVVKNLKLLYIPDRIDPLRLQVSVTFRAN